MRNTHLNPFMPSGSFYFNILDRFISYIRGFWLVFIMPWFVELSEPNANSVDPDQTPRSAASDLDVHCLLVSLLWDARLILVKCAGCRLLHTTNCISSIKDKISRYKLIVIDVIIRVCPDHFCHYIR